jgi:hypothetical protein
MNHPAFHEAVLAERARRFDHAARAARRSNSDLDSATSSESPLVLRLCTVHDDPAIERLAGLEGRPAPGGRFVVAEVGGEIVAAKPLDGGPVLADPFRPTLHLLPLMELRARQLGEPGERRRVLARTWRLARN